MSSPEIIYAPREFASEYTDNNLASTGLVGVGFGFAASRVRVTNDGAGRAFLSFKSTSVGSTGGFQLSSGETLDLGQFGGRVSGFTAMATSTGVLLRVGAWA